MRKLNYLGGIALIVALLFIGCDKERKKIEEINYLSQFQIPLDSEILDYHDNLETAVVYKIRIKEGLLNDFMSNHDFKILDTLPHRNGITSDIYDFHSIENGFPYNREKIYGQKLKICNRYTTSIILNEKEAILWGETQYPVDLPDSIQAKKPW